MSDDERTVWNTTFAIVFRERRAAGGTMASDAQRYAAIMADSAVDGLREEMKQREKE